MGYGCFAMGCDAKTLLKDLCLYRHHMRRESPMNREYALEIRGGADNQGGGNGLSCEIVDEILSFWVSPQKALMESVIV